MKGGENMSVAPITPYEAYWRSLQNRIFEEINRILVERFIDADSEVKIYKREIIEGVLKITQRDKESSLAKELRENYNWSDALRKYGNAGWDWSSDSNVNAFTFSISKEN